MTRAKICEILNINKSTISRIHNGYRNSPLKDKINYLLSFEDTFDAIVRSEAFGELCDLVIKSALRKKEYKEVELALNGQSLRNFLIGDFKPDDLHYSALTMFDKSSYTERKMTEFIKSEFIEKMCDVAMRSTRKLSVRRMCNTIKLIHCEFWKPSMKSNEVSKM